MTTTPPPAPTDAGRKDLRHILMVLSNMSMAAVLFMAMPLTIDRIDDWTRVPWTIAVGLMVCLNLLAVGISLYGMVAPAKPSDAFGD